MDWNEVITTIAGSSVLTTLLKHILDRNKAKQKTESVFIQRVRDTLKSCSMLSLETWGTEPQERIGAKRNAMLIETNTVELLQQLGSLYTSNRKLESSCKQLITNLFVSLGNFQVDSPLDEKRHRENVEACTRMKSLLDNLNRKHS